MSNNIGVLGLDVIGKNLAWNIEDKKYSVSIHSRDNNEINDTIQKSHYQKIYPTYNLKEFIDSLKGPRKILLVIKADSPTDNMINVLLPLLDDESILVDDDNTNYQDTIRRNKTSAENGVNFISMGVLGGEVDALTGPSLMPGGRETIYNKVSDVLDTIATKAQDGASCVTYIGPNGAGHYVKMVHNGIEYADMQLIAESYTMMRDLLGMGHTGISQTLKDWNVGELGSYLIEITGDIFTKLDENNEPLVEKILDTTGQKGTGEWTSINTLELGIPLTIITESVFVRFISSIKEERVNASKSLNGPRTSFDGNRKEFLKRIRKTLYMNKIYSYAQGSMQMRKSSEGHEWGLKLGELTMVWREGCIIRAQFLQKIKNAYDNNPELENLLLDPHFKNTVIDYQDTLRDVVAIGVRDGVSIPGFSASVNYYDSYRSEDLSANLIQARRDYLGIHTYERKDHEGVFRTQWDEE